MTLAMSPFVKLLKVAFRFYIQCGKGENDKGSAGTQHLARVPGPPTPGAHSYLIHDINGSPSNIFFSPIAALFPICRQINEGRFWNCI